MEMVLGAETTSNVAIAQDPELHLSFLTHETLVWQKGPVIGNGRFGQVLVALRIPSAEFLAVKEVFIQEEVDQGNDVSSLSIQRVVSLKQIEREAQIIQSLDHPNIVRFFGTERYGPTFHIFMEYLHAGSLNKLLKDFGPFEEATICSYIRQLTCGVEYLHRLGIAHRDLKCANVLLADDGIIKIGDFGTAKRVDVQQEIDEDDDDSRLDTARSVREGVGTPYWMAPEIIRAERGEDRWQKADIWGIGCTMLEMATGKPPWHYHSNPLTAMFHIASHDHFPEFPVHLSPTAHSFLSLCFDKNPQTRSSATELLLHPFLNDPEIDLLSTQQESKLGSEERKPLEQPSPDELCVNSSNVVKVEKNDCEDVIAMEELTQHSLFVPFSISSSPSSSSGAASFSSSLPSDEEESIVYSSDDDKVK